MTNLIELPSLYTTEDGSTTLYNARLGEHYHSTHGAMQESLHIFIEAGLKHRLGSVQDEPLRLLEIGFGTGLNALLTWEEAETRGLSIHYTTLELYPLPSEIYIQLRYSTPHMVAQTQTRLMQLHTAPWGVEVALDRHFGLHKIDMDLLTYRHPTERRLDLIYFDAFSPETQPELWSQEIFERLLACCAPGAILVTYCAKGEVRRRLERAGFSVVRLPGPLGKREILRATVPTR